MLSDATRARDFPSLTGIAYLNSAAESIPPLCVGSRCLAPWFRLRCKLPICGGIST